MNDLTGLKQGEVISCNMVTGRLEVQSDIGNVEHIYTDVRWAGGFYSSLLGFKTKYLPPVGTKVLLMVGSDEAAFIVGHLNDNIFPDEAAGERRNHTGSSKVTIENELSSMVQPQDSEDAFLGHGYGTDDMLEGEIDFSNEIGVGIKFCTTMMKMSANERAQILCAVNKDMVRIVSGAFRHFSAFGNFEIYDDGRLNVKWDGTSYNHEVWGKNKLKDPKGELDSDDPTKVNLDDPQEFKNYARWRFSQCIGYIGDFINGYVTDPAKVLEDIAMRSGKIRWHVGNNGSFLMQSVAEIALEKVVRIPVPVEIKRWDDPQGNIDEDFGKMDADSKKFLLDWDPRQPENSYQAVYQLREYARWLSGVSSLARTHQANKDWRIDKESDTPEPDPNNDEEDRTETNEALQASRTSYRYVYATIRIMRDGSICLRDGYLSSVVMSKGNVQVSAANNLLLQAAGDINIEAGGNCNVKARKSIELNAVYGGIKAKATAWFHALSEKGSMVLESRAVRPDPEADEDELDESKPKPVIYPEALIIKTTQGNARLDVKEQLHVHSSHIPGFVDVDEEEIEDTPGILFTSNISSIKTSSGRHVQIAARTGQMMLWAQKSVTVVGSKMLAWLSSGFGTFSVNNQMTLRGNRLDVTGGVKSPRIIGVTMAAIRRRIGNPEHENHIGTIPDDALSEGNQFWVAKPYGEASNEEEVAAEQAADRKKATDENFAFASTTASSSTFNKDVEEDYNSDVESGDDDLLFLETLTQQELRLNTSEDYNTYLDTDTSMWPGQLARQFKSTPPSDLSLDEPLNKSYDTLENKGSILNKGSFQTKYKL